jgi:hypothetical protein
MPNAVPTPVYTDFQLPACPNIVGIVLATAVPLPNTPYKFAFPVAPLLDCAELQDSAEPPPIYAPIGKSDASVRAIMVLDKSVPFTLKLFAMFAPFIISKLS